MYIMRILFSGSKLDWTINAFVSKNYFCFVALEIQNKYLKYKAYTRRHNKMELTLKNMPPNLRIRELQLSLKFSLCSSLIPSPCLPSEMNNILNLELIFSVFLLHLCMWL